MGVPVVLVMKANDRVERFVLANGAGARFGVALSTLGDETVRVAWANEPEATDERVEDVVFLGVLEIPEDYLRRAETIEAAAERVRSVVAPTR